MINAHIGASDVGKAFLLRFRKQVLPCEFPHPNGCTRKRAHMAKSLIDALGPRAAHQIFGVIVWRFHNTQEALVALQPLLQKFQEGEDLQALRREVEALYLADPVKAVCRSHLFNTGDAIRSSGGHASWRAAVLGSLEKWWDASQHAAAILEDTGSSNGEYTEGDNCKCRKKQPSLGQGAPSRPGSRGSKRKIPLETTWRLWRGEEYVVFLMKYVILEGNSMASIYHTSWIL